MAVAPARFRVRMTGQDGKKDPAGLVKGDDAKPLRGASNGSEVTDIWDFLRTTVFDRALPSLSSADLMGTKLMLYCEEPLDTTSNPASSDFTATPEPGVALSGAGCEYRLGWKLGLVSGSPCRWSTASRRRGPGLPTILDRARARDPVQPRRQVLMGGMAKESTWLLEEYAARVHNPRGCVLRLVLVRRCCYLHLQFVRREILQNRLIIEMRKKK